MTGLRLNPTTLGGAAAWLALLCVAPDTASGQRTSAKKSASKAAARTKTADRDAPAADRIVLRDGKELLGQVVGPTSKGDTVVLARREWLRAHLPDRMKKWEDAERTETVSAGDQRRRRLEAWRRERPSVPAPGDRITPWLDRELSKGSGSDFPPILMSLQLGRGEATSVQRRADQAARALRSAWLLGLPEPETTPLATLADSIAGRGTLPEGDDPVSVDRLLPPSVEPEDRWLLRRAATEVLNDEGLRFVRFGNTLLPEPAPGQPPDPTLGATLIDGTIRDVLTGGRADPLPARLSAVADRGRVGMIVTRIAPASDLGSVSAESTLYARGTGGWDRIVWRSNTLRVGEVPPFVVDAVAADPQVKALIGLVDSIGGGLVPPEMKQRGVVIGTTAGGAAVMARAALTRSLVGLALDLETKESARRGSAKR